jgi:hypothetical protein
MSLRAGIRLLRQNVLRSSSLVRPASASTFRRDSNYREDGPLENHDEPRAAVRFSPDEHKAQLNLPCSGMRFFHQGQFED